MHLFLDLFLDLFAAPQMLKFYTFWGGTVSLLGGQAPPGVRVILTLPSCHKNTRRTLSIGVRQIGHPLAMFATVSAQLEQN